MILRNLLRLSSPRHPNYLYLLNRHCNYSTMAQHKSYSYEGFGDLARQSHGYSQAVRTGDNIHIAGQGKPPPPRSTPNPTR